MLSASLTQLEYASKQWKSTFSYSRAKTLRAPEISLHFDSPPIASSNNLHHSQPKHGLVSLTDMFTCSLALNRMFSCPLDCSSLLILLHSRFIHPHLVPIQHKSGQIEHILPHQELIFFLGLTRTTFFVDVGRHPSVFLEGECKCSLPPSARTITDLPQIGYSLAILHTLALPPTPRPFPGTELYILTCRIQRRCPFTVNPPRFDDLPGIVICCWCVCATQISHTFFQNRIYINLFRQNQTLRCICVHPH